MAPLAYFVSNNGCNTEARHLLNQCHHCAPPLQQQHGYLFRCYSSMATPYNTNPATYQIIIASDGSSSCSCPDFQTNGVACKHMRVAVISLNEMHANGYSIPAIATLTSLNQAQSVQQKQLTHLLTNTSSQLSIDPSQPNHICTAAIIIDTALQGKNVFVAQDSELLDGEIRNKIEEEGEDSKTTDNKFYFSVICQGSAAREALDKQKTACVFFKLDQAMPKLGQLGTVLKGACMTSSDIPCIVSFIKQLEVLTSELKHMMSETKPVMVMPDSSANTNCT